MLAALDDDGEGSTLALCSQRARWSRLERPAQAGERGAVEVEHLLSRVGHSETQGAAVLDLRRKGLELTWL